MKSIPFNKPFLTGKETRYMEQAVNSGKLSGNGMFTAKCHKFFREKYKFSKSLLTSSCTDALEMAAILINILPGDEVIVPSYTFVSTANAFLLRGAKIIFADSHSDQPNINENQIESLITERTKAIVLVHYAGISCDMDLIRQITKDKEIFLIEDAAHSIDSFYKDQPLGGIGDIGTFSFHETKNIISGEGGMIAVNNEQLHNRSEIIWEKGTNRAAFFRGEVDKYNWVDLGSSFLPSELTAAFLYAQLENLNKIQNKRVHIWKRYQESLGDFCQNFGMRPPVVPEYATVNGHLFYLICESNEQRSNLIDHFRSKGIWAVFHYLPLHLSPYYSKVYSGPDLKNSVLFGECLVRLPLYYTLSENEQDRIMDEFKSFCLT